MYNRWYDKYPDLKSLLLLLETIDEYNIELIAQDFLQISGITENIFAKASFESISFKES